MKRLCLIICLALFLTGCEPQETKPFTYVEKPVGSDEIKFIGRYQIISEQSGFSSEFLVYEIIVNGRKRELHWNGYSGTASAFAILSLEDEE